MASNGHSTPSRGSGLPTTQPSPAQSSPATQASAQEALASNARRIIRAWPVGAALEPRVDGELAFPQMRPKRQLPPQGERTRRHSRAPCSPEVGLGTGQKRQRVARAEARCLAELNRGDCGSETLPQPKESRLTSSSSAPTAISHLGPIHSAYPSFFPAADGADELAQAGLPADPQLAQFAPDFAALFASSGLAGNDDTARWRASQVEAVLATEEMRQVMRGVAADPEYGSL